MPFYLSECGNQKNNQIYINHTNMLISRKHQEKKTRNQRHRHSLDPETERTSHPEDKEDIQSRSSGQETHEDGVFWHAGRCLLRHRRDLGNTTLGQDRQQGTQHQALPTCDKHRHETEF